MGIFDEAIREHLELKRQHGAGDSELRELEDEAFGPPPGPATPRWRRPRRGWTARRRPSWRRSRRSRSCRAGRGRVAADAAQELPEIEEPPPAPDEPAPSPSRPRSIRRRRALRARAAARAGEEPDGLDRRSADRALRPPGRRPARRGARRSRPRSRTSSSPSSRFPTSSTRRSTRPRRGRRRRSRSRSEAERRPRAEPRGGAVEPARGRGGRGGRGRPRGDAGVPPGHARARSPLVRAAAAQGLRLRRLGNQPAMRPTAA